MTAFSVKSLSSRGLFRVYIASSKHEGGGGGGKGGWENSRQLSKPKTQSRVCIAVENSPNSPNVQMRLCKQGKKSSIPFIKTFLKKYSINDGKCCFFFLLLG